MSTYTLGIDLGSRTIKAVLFDVDNGKVAFSIVKDTTTDSKGDAKRIFEDVLRARGLCEQDIARTIATGYGRGMASFATDTSTEITCHAIGVSALFPQARTIVDIGGQDSKAIHLGKDGLVRDFSMNDRCAAGTGRFLEVVAKILGTNTQGLAEMAGNAASVPEISSMCVVFAESEVIGMLARGVSPHDLSAGIHKSIARRVAGLAERGRVEAPIVFTGGVAQNRAMVMALGNELKERLLVPDDPRITGALGAALLAARQLGKPAKLECTNFPRPKTVHLEELPVPASVQKEAIAIAATPAQSASSIEDIFNKSRSEKPPNFPCGSSSVPSGGFSKCCEEKEQPCHLPNESQKVGPCCETKEPASCCSGPKPATSECCGEKPAEPCQEQSTCSVTVTHPTMRSVPSLSRFDRMVQNSIDYAREQKAHGKKIVSIFCEYTPREIIIAAGAVPVCACGGSHSLAVVSEKELPANLCPLIKSSYGYAMERANPLFEMSDMVVAETTCDGKKKMYELLQREHKMHVLELTQKPDEQAAFDHWYKEVVLLKESLEALTGNKITDDALRDAIRCMNTERQLRRKVASFAGSTLTGREVLDAKSLIACIPCDLKAYEDIIREAQSAPPRHSHKPRILLTGVPLPHGAEKVMDLLEQAGAIVVVQENCTGIKPLVENVSLEGDPLSNIAKKYFHLQCSCMMPNAGRFELIDNLIPENNVQGVIDLVWQACHTYNVESVLLKKHIDERFGLPFMKIETDYSPSDTEQLRVRIEAFLSVVEAHKNH